MSDATVVRMPRLADTLVEGTLGRWLKQVGENIAHGEPLASIETDKVTTELTSPAAGTLLEQLVPEGRTVPIETPIARIGQSGAAPVPIEQAPPTAHTAAPKPTPVAARLLAEHGLTADQVPSRASRLTRDDVLSYVEARGSTPRSAEPLTPERMNAQRELTPLTSMRRAIADHIAQAYKSIPHGQTVMDTDLTRVVAWRDAQTGDGARPTFTALFVYALGRQLATVVDAPVDVGVAVALERGLIVPVVRAADGLSLAEIAEKISDLATRARSNRLKPEETQGARMTVTNVGSFGNLTASPIIPLGQIGILGPGLVERRPMPSADGGIRPGWRCLLSLMFDRRVFDDFAADQFLAGVIAQLTALAR